MVCVHRAEHQPSRGIPLAAPHQILSWFNSGGVACKHRTCSAASIVQLVAQLIINKKGLKGIKYLNRTHAANGDVLKRVFALRCCCVFLLHRGSTCFRHCWALGGIPQHNKHLCASQPRLWGQGSNTRDGKAPPCCCSFQGC